MSPNSQALQKSRGNLEFSCAIVEQRWSIQLMPNARIRPKQVFCEDTDLQLFFLVTAGIAQFQHKCIF